MSAKIEPWLTSQDDWEIWYDRLQLKAKYLRIWSIINPDSTKEDHEKSIIKEPELPDEKNIDEENFSAQLDLYEFRKNRFDTQQLAFYEIDSFISSTVSADLLDVTRDKHSLHERIKALQQAYQPTDNQRYYKAHADWQKALQSPAKQNFYAWINGVQNALIFIRREGLPEAERKHANRAIISALKPYMPLWAHSSLRDEIKGVHTTTEQLLIELRSTYDFEGFTNNKPSGRSSAVATITLNG